MPDKSHVLSLLQCQLQRCSLSSCLNIHFILCVCERSVGILEILIQRFSEISKKPRESSGNAASGELSVNVIQCYSHFITMHAGDSHFFFIFKMRCKKFLQLKLKMPGLFTTWSWYLATVGLIFKSLSCRVSDQIFCRKSSCGKSLFFLSPFSC